MRVDAQLVRFRALFIGAVVLAVLSSVDAGARPQTPVVREARWTQSYPTAEPTGWRHPVAIALSPTATCVGIAHAGVVSVFDLSGTIRWSWNFAKVNRFIQPAGLALSPTCDAVAVVGTPEYKYTWLAQRHAGARALATRSTPTGAAFDHRGEHLAIGTGGHDVHLFTLAGIEKWKTTFPDSCCIVEQLEFSRDGQSLLVRGRGIGVLHLDGTVAWSALEQGMAASRDMTTFVSWSEPPHGPGIGSTVALEGDGRPLWQTRIFSSTVGAIVSAAGDRLAAWVNLNQAPSEADGFARDHPMALMVLARNGDRVATIPATHGTLLAFSPDATRVLVQTPAAVEEVDLEGRVHQRIPLLTDEPGAATVIVADDYSGVLVRLGRQDARVRWYGLR